MDTLWNDVSEFQCDVDDSYPYDVLCIRSNDNTYRDHHFQSNYAWARNALDRGKLKALLVYCVYRETWQDDLATMIDVIGTPPHGRIALMIDVESWQGQIQGDNSTTINDLYWGLANWVGSPSRVLGYGNTSDLDTLWPNRPPGIRFIIAAYGSDPNYPGKLGHQFTDGTSGGPLLVPPFGYADVNSADGYSIDEFCTALGLADTPSPTRKASMITLPATPMPADPNSDPATWPQLNHDVFFVSGTGWAAVFGAQEFGGRTEDTARGFLRLASWETSTGLVPVSDDVSTAGSGIVIYDHTPTNVFTAPPDASGITLNYAAPGGAGLGI